MLDMKAFNERLKKALVITEKRKYIEVDVTTILNSVKTTTQARVMRGNLYQFLIELSDSTTEAFGVSTLELVLVDPNKIIIETRIN